MTKNKIIKSSYLLFVIALFFFAIFSACEKNDIKVVSSEVGGSTTGTTSTTSSGTTTGGAPCSPSTNSVSFNTPAFYGFSSLSTNPSTYTGGYYTLYGYGYVGSNLRTVRVILPVLNAPVVSTSYDIDYSYFSTNTLSSTKCAFRIYENVSGSFYYGYGFSGKVYVTVTGNSVSATFCNISCHEDIGSTFISNFTATGKINV